MTDVRICRHFRHPFSQGKIKLSHEEKRYAKLGLFLLPILIIPGLIAFYGISYYFKNRKCKQITQQKQKPVHKKTAKAFKKQKVSVKPKKSVLKNPSSFIPPLQSTGYAIDVTGVRLKTQEAAVISILTEGEFTRNATACTNHFLELVRHASMKFPDVLDPAVLKANREINPQLYIILQLMRLGQVFELRQKIDLPDGDRMSFEGFYGEFTAPMIAASFSSFYQDLDKNHLPKHFRWLTSDSHNWIQDNFKELLSDKIVGKADIQAITQILQEPDFKGPIVAGSGTNEHYTVVGFIGSIAFLINRDSRPSGISLYKIKDRSLLTEASLREIINSTQQDRSSYFGHRAMLHTLGGELLTTIKLPHQVSGSCSYKSTEGFLCTLFAFQFLYNSDPHQFYQNLEKPSELKSAFKTAMPAFNQWLNYDRRLVYDDLLEDWERVKKRPKDDRERITYKKTLDYIHQTPAYEEMIKNEDT